MAIAKRKSAAHLNRTVPVPERAILVAVDSPRAQHWSAQASMQELAMLARTAGAEPVEQMIQRLPHPDPHGYLGKGKLEELIAARETLDYRIALFDDELTPAQQRTLENALSVKVIDRTALILDIFAQRARTREGALQVALAQHEYLLPRLAGQWSHLERMEGAIGSRGPGETQLETDRRLIRNLIKRLKQQLAQVHAHRERHRKQRRRGETPVVALVGYTNAGKSTLMNALTHAQVRAANRLFDTLDPVTRRCHINDDLTVLLTDTVGFIQKLPTQLVAAFRATLEELDEADLLLHVVDITHHDAAEQAQTVEDTLAELNVLDCPRITVLNKADRFSGAIAESDGVQTTRAPDSRALKAELHAAWPGAVLLSAATGWGLDALHARIAALITGNLSPAMVAASVEGGELPVSRAG